MRARWLFVLVALASMAAPRLARADEEAGAGAKKGRGKAVVVADVSEDATANARARAQVFEQLRKLGFEPDGRADVAAAAGRSNAFVAGKIATDLTALEALRRELGVALLVRVSEEWRKGETIGLRVSVVSEGGTDSRVVESQASDPGAPLPDTLAESLEAAGAAPAAKAKSGERKPRRDERDDEDAGQDEGEATSGGAIVYEGAPKPAEAARPNAAAVAKLWQARGGVRAMFAAHAVGTGLIIPDWEAKDKNPITKLDETERSAAYGIGGGVGFRVGMIYLPLPEPAVSSGTFPAFRISVGADTSVLYGRRPHDFSYQLDNAKQNVIGRKTRQENAALDYTAIPLEVGIHVAFGNFRGQTKWHGVMLGVAWAPTYVLHLDISTVEGGTYFNYAGVEGTIDVVTIDADDKHRDMQPQLRLFGLLLPRISADIPWLATGGIGVTWF